MAKFNLTVNIKDTYLKRLERLAEYRDESLQDCMECVAKNVFQRVPRNLRPADRPLTDLDIDEVGISDDGVPFIRLGNGRIFYDYFSKSRNILLYHVMRDLTPKQFKPETYSLGMEARRLYKEQPPKKWFPHDKDAIVVEVGAFVGYKAVAFLDALGPKGKVVAIELAPENYALLKRNIEENKLSERLIAHHAGVWSACGTMSYYGEGWMQYTIANMDDKQYAYRGEVTVSTLDSLLDISNISCVDYMNIQVNGAEVEAIQGLRRWFDRVRVFRIAAYYRNEGDPIVNNLRHILEARNCKIVHSSEKGSITAINRNFTFS